LLGDRLKTRLLRVRIQEGGAVMADPLRSARYVSAHLASFDPTFALFLFPMRYRLCVEPMPWREMQEQCFLQEFYFRF
jgi:hypothetical protein